MIELIEWEDPVVTMSSIGTIVKMLRSEKGLSQEALGLDAGLSQYAVYALEHGRNTQFASVLLVLDALGRELVIRRKKDANHI